MAEPITEMYCENCGRRYAFDRPKRGGVARIRRVSRGLRSYVLNEAPTLGDAMADAWTRLESEGMSRQLEAFRDTFSLCLDCRRYVCHDCWNAADARCRSCAPTAEDLVVASEAAAAPAVAPALDETSGWIATEAPAEVVPTDATGAPAEQVTATPTASVAKAAPPPAAAQPVVATASVVEALPSPAAVEPTAGPVETPLVSRAAPAETAPIPRTEAEAAPAAVPGPSEAAPPPPPAAAAPPKPAVVAGPPGPSVPAATRPALPRTPAPVVAATAASHPVPVPAVPVVEVDADVFAAARAAGLPLDGARASSTEAGSAAAEPARVAAAPAGAEPDVPAATTRPVARQRRRFIPTPRARGPIRCRECGLHLPAAARYCRRCGVRQAEEA